MEGTPPPRPVPEESPSTGALHHVELYVRDLERTATFWTWLLAWLGYEAHQEWAVGFSWRLGPTYLAFVQAPEGAGGDFDRRSVGLNHVAFHAASRFAVDELTDDLRERGVRILYEDRHPFAGGEDHYAVFFEDPDGLKVEVVAPPSSGGRPASAAGHGQ